MEGEECLTVKDGNKINSEICTMKEKGNVLCNEKPRYANDKMPMRIFEL